MGNRAYILIGGNLGDRFKLLNQARIGIEKLIGEIVKISSIYETAAWGFESENDFLNQVLLVSTDLRSIDLLKKCQEIENSLGRVRESENYASRTMDIDILFYNNEIINEPDLIVPHKHLHKRRFTLEPLAEISPEFIHPKFNKSVKELIAECKDKEEVKKI